MHDARRRARERIITAQVLRLERHLAMERAWVATPARNGASAARTARGSAPAGPGPK
jgi:hypothetical protein